LSRHSSSTTRRRLLRLRLASGCLATSLAIQRSHCAKVLATSAIGTPTTGARRKL
jgi:hypothetical protein